MRHFNLNGIKGIPPAVGHYTHAIELENGTVYLSGQKAWDEKGNLIEGGVREQTELVIANVKNILEHIGLSMERIVFIQCNLANTKDYEAFNAVYSQSLGDLKPCRTFLGGCSLRGGALVELIVTAYNNNKK
jgi:2-iminobutanoate/2-iminopropanoate deaminase